MAKHRPGPKQAAQAPPPEPQWRRTAPAISIVLLLAATAICVAIGYLTRFGLNPDGVSYLDLSNLAAGGDWTHFVQGYWSPLYPLLLAIPDILVHPDINGQIMLAHVVNIAAVGCAVVVLFRWIRLEVARAGDAGALFAAAAVGVLLLCSFSPPRVEAVTPDVLLLAVLIWLTYELIAHRGERWLITGALLGATYLTKTSAWPWLLLAIPVRLIGAGSAPGRMNVWRSHAVGAVVMLTWIVPMSVRYGHPTLGSSGRLNFSWYIMANSSRLPDGDRGMHNAYTAIEIAPGVSAPVAHFNEWDRWTYQPWGDPTAWSAGVLSESGRAPSAFEILGYWLRAVGNTFAFWLGPMIGAIMLPLFLLNRRERERGPPSRDAATVALLGLAGVMQFVVIHTEPRLIAPFAAMLGLGAAAWCCSAMPRRMRADRIVVGLGLVGVVVAFGSAIAKTLSDIRDLPRVEASVAQVEQMRGNMRATAGGPASIAIMGPVAPVMRALYWTGAHVALQVPTRTLNALQALPIEQRRALLLDLLGGKFDAVWQTTDQGEVEMLNVPRR